MYEKLRGTLAMALIVAGCSSSSASPTSSGDAHDGGPGTAADSGGESGGTSTDGALEIVSFTNDVQAITDPSDGRSAVAHEVTFIAIVTARGGIDTIAGGQLLDDQGKTYAAFGTGAQKGTYTASVDWSQINRVSPITFRAPGAGRTFSAKFFDNDGREATAPLHVSFFCGSDTHSDAWNACRGTCQYPLDARTACGCDTPTDCTTNPSKSYGYCWNGTCRGVPLNTRCFDGGKALPDIINCEEYCGPVDHIYEMEFASLADCLTAAGGVGLKQDAKFQAGKGYTCSCAH